MIEKQKTIKDIFGFDEEQIKDLKPLLNLQKMEIGTEVVVTILSEEPREVDVDGKFGNNKAKMIDVLNESAEEMALFCGSKSMLLGLAKIYKRNNTLKNTKVKISIQEVEFKKGLNRCYIVEELSE